MMTHVEHDTRIHAPRKVVVSYATDPKHWTEWYEGVTSAHADYDTPEVGGTVTLTYHTAGVPMEMTMTIIEYNPPRLIVYEMDGMMTGTYR